MTLPRLGACWIVTVLLTAGCGFRDPSGPFAGVGVTHFVVTGTFTLDTTISVGPSAATTVVASTVNVQLVAGLDVQLPYGADVLALMEVPTCDVCSANYTTLGAPGPRRWAVDSVSLTMATVNFLQPIISLRGVMVGDTVTGTMRASYSTSVTRIQVGTFTAVRQP